jgi:hypothetical protein
MIGVLDGMQRGRRAEPLYHGFDQLRFRELVAGALDKEHRELDLAEVFCPFHGWLAGRVQRKSNERKTTDARERGDRLRLRRHAAAE